MSREPVKSAVRALEILKLFSEERRELNQKEIIGRLHYPQSSATFLLKSMVHTGYLSFDRNRRTYLPAPEVYRIGEWLENFGYEHMFRQGVLTALMEDLRSKTGETISITTQNDIYVQWHRIVEGKDLSATQRISEGGSFPLTWSAYGCVLLSRESDTQIDRIIRLINAREPNRLRKADVPRTLAMLRDIRSKGAFLMRNPCMDGASSIATLLPVQIAGRNVAIGVGGDGERIEANREQIMRTLAATVAAHADDLASTFCEDRQLPIAA